MRAPTASSWAPATVSTTAIANWSESVIALHPDGSGGTGVNAGKPLDSYTPTNFQTLDNGDTDVGSTAPAILPVPATSSVQHLAVQSGKDAKLRLINLANLSGQGGPGHVGGEVGTVVNVPQGGGVFTQPGVWVNPVDGTTWVFVVNSNGASGLQLIFDVNGNPSLAPRWQNVEGGTSPIIANNLVFFISGSTVRALDPVSGNVSWSLAHTGGFHWESLIVANGVVYATDGLNRLTAFAHRIGIYHDHAHEFGQSVDGGEQCGVHGDGERQCADGERCVRCGQHAHQRLWRTVASAVGPSMRQRRRAAPAA